MPYSDVAQWQAIPREVALRPLAEERRYDGLAMDEVTSCDWAELARCGKARQWWIGQPLPHNASVMPYATKESLPPAAACHQKGGERRIVDLLAVKQ